MPLIFLDTNVFLYAIGGEGPHREPCRAVLTAVGNGALGAVTNTEVLQEILYVRGRRRGMADAVEAVREAAGLVSDVLPVTKDDVLSACVLLGRHQGLGSRDALHAAVMKSNALHLLVSIDTDFDVLKHLKRMTPQDALTMIDR